MLILEELTQLKLWEHLLIWCVHLNGQVRIYAIVGSKPSICTNYCRAAAEEQLCPINLSLGWTAAIICENKGTHYSGAVEKLSFLHISKNVFAATACTV